MVGLRGLAKDREMFVRVKKSGKYQYLQIVESQRVDGRVRQPVEGVQKRRRGGIVAAV